MILTIDDAHASCLSYKKQLSGFLGQIKDFVTVIINKYEKQPKCNIYKSKGYVF